MMHEKLAIFLAKAADRKPMRLAGIVIPLALMLYAGSIFVTGVVSLSSRRAGGSELILVDADAYFYAGGILGLALLINAKAYWCHHHESVEYVGTIVGSLAMAIGFGAVALRQLALGFF